MLICSTLSMSRGGSLDFQSTDNIAASHSDVIKRRLRVYTCPMRAQVPCMWARIDSRDNMNEHHMHFMSIRGISRS